MSAVPNPLPMPPHPPVAPALPEPQRRGIRWLILGIGALLLAALGTWYQLNTSGGGPVSVVPTQKAFIGDLDQTIRVTGETAAQTFANITSPRMEGREGNQGLTILTLVPNGTLVKRGDIVATIDAAGLRDHLDEIRDLAAQAQADIDRRKAEQAVDWTALQQTLRVAKATLDKALLDQKMASLKTSLDREILQLAVDEAQARYTELTKDLVTKKQSQESEIRTLELTRRRHERHAQRHVSDLEKFTLRSPIDGMAVMQQQWAGDQFRLTRLGDQVRAGQVFVKIVTPASLVLDGTVSQSDSGRVQLGQPATVSFDAYPDLKLPGHVSAIGAIAVRGWRQQYYIRNVRVVVQLDRLDPRMIPDLSGAAEVMLHRQASQLLIPRAAVHERGGTAYVYVKTPQGLARRNVTLGDRNTLYTVVTQGLSAGEAVSVVPTAD